MSGAEGRLATVSRFFLDNRLNLWALCRSGDENMVNLLSKVLSFGEGREMKRLWKKVGRINSLEEEISRLSDEDLARKTVEFRERFDQGESLDDLLYETFAVVREVAKRTLNMRHFDVQILGGIVLHEGKIAEMKTGEGKTLVATLPIYLNSLEGKGIHLVTVNDYLAKRDSQWMGPIYKFLGLEVGLLQHDLPASERKVAYRADVAYGTNSEFGFDYLRDNMVTSLPDKVQRGHHFAIVDEVDSILIDEARTPLIISGPAEESTEIYYQFARIVPRLKVGEDYEIEEKTRTASIGEEGVLKVEKMLGVDNLYEHENTRLVHHLNQALRAHALFKRDVDYIVKNGEVIIVDEFTGRLMPGRRYSEGLHQAIEAREGVRIRQENQTLATITLQNYFRMYEKLAGMTGTAATEAEEFRKIYKMDTVVIPTNEPMIRIDMPDVVYKTEDIKFGAVVDEIVRRHEKGQPVLVGTISIEKSERLSKLLKKRGIPHQVLNAKYHEKEAEIIALAGRKGTVTIATNMAGRGVDIVLEEGVPDLGGLHIIGTERHESRRIDNQLRGRSGRQGDPGSSQFFLSLEDDLMKMFGMDRVRPLMDRFNFPEDEPISHNLVSKSIETAQKQVESRNFNIRKNVLEYDDVMNKQREVIYQQRDRILEGDDLSDKVNEMTAEVVGSVLRAFTSNSSYPEEWDLEGMLSYLCSIIPVEVRGSDYDLEDLTPGRLEEDLVGKALDLYQKREEEIGAETLRQLERYIMLRVIDNRWREHLYEMDYLKEGIGLRAIGQRDPLVEYKHEGYEMFQAMIQNMKEDIVRYLFRVKVAKEEARPQPLRLVTSQPAAKKQTTVHRVKVGRNDPCPCGSGKKYKKCCGR
nr:preprotein translocase subunit SecA [Candidatus Hakubella thermalkaliphila]